jgi:hypothetical protein
MHEFAHSNDRLKQELLFEIVMPINELGIGPIFEELLHLIKFFVMRLSKKQQFFQYLIDFELLHLFQKQWA